jgi:putative transcriptional regulator
MQQVEDDIMVSKLRYGLSIAVGGLLCASALLAQSRRSEDLRVGKLLVAPRDSADPNFAESVVLLVDYGEDGAVGLMINRQTKLPVSRVLPELKESSKYSDPAYLGGPVTIGAVMALLQSRTEPHPTRHLFGNVYLVTTKPELEAALAAGIGPAELRIYLGYCGWGPGQLENELQRGDWYIFDGSELLVFDSHPSTLWSRMIARTEVRTARMR